MSEKVLGVQCRKCHNVIPLTIGHNIYCPNCKALMVIANLATTDKEEEKMNKDLDALNQLIDDAVNEEKSLAVKADELALQSKQFAEWLAQKKHNDERLAQLWDFVKEFMVENNLTEHENDYIKLKLSPSGKYKAEDINQIDDSLCDIKKVLNNKKVKSFVELNGHLPEGVQSTGYILRKTLKEK